MYRLRDVSMDFAVPLRPSLDGNVATVPAWQLARGVEKCECPRQYSSTSCQNPSIGFYRWLPPPYYTESTIIIQLVGESRPCSCASRSATCDVETGACLVSDTPFGHVSCIDSLILVCRTARRTRWVLHVIAALLDISVTRN